MHDDIVLLPLHVAKVNLAEKEGMEVAVMGMVWRDPEGSPYTTVAGRDVQPYRALNALTVVPTSMLHEVRRRGSFRRPHHHQRPSHHMCCVPVLDLYIGLQLPFPGVQVLESITATCKTEQDTCVL